VWEHADTLAYRAATGDDGVLCEHEWLPWGVKSNGLSGEMGTPGSIDNPGQRSARGNVEVDAPRPLFPIKSCLESVVDEELQESFCENLAPCGKGGAPGFVNGAVTVQDATNEIPQERRRYDRDIRRETFARHDTKLYETVSERNAPDRPAENDSACLGDLLSDRAGRGNKITDKNSGLIIETDKVDGPVVHNAPVTEHETQEISEIRRPSSELLHCDGISGSMGALPSDVTGSGAEEVLTGSQVPSGAIDTDTTMLTEQISPSVSIGPRKRAPVNHSCMICQKCGAVKTVLGLEPTIELYVAHLVEVFREVRRVLRDDGTVWLVIGDSYFGDSPTRKTSAEAFSKTWDPTQTRSRGGLRRSAASVGGLKPKDLCMIPARVVLALQADGWFLRSEIPWPKKNSMPGSQRDRPTTGHEHVFLLTKSSRYYWDGEAVRENGVVAAGTRRTIGKAKQGGQTRAEASGRKPSGNEAKGYTFVSGSRTRRTTDWWFEGLDRLIAEQRAYLAHLERVRDDGGALCNEDGDLIALQVNTKPLALAHFASFPPDLVEPCIKAATSERGACPRCGAAWERVIGRVGQLPGRERNRGGRNDGYALPAQWENGQNPTTITTLGWRPTCDCYDGRYRSEYAKPRKARKRAQRDAWDGRWQRVRARPGREDWPTQPCLCLDMFAGVGTVGLVAQQLGRRYVLIDAKHEYCAMTLGRLHPGVTFVEEKPVETLPLFKGF